MHKTGRAAVVGLALLTLVAASACSKTDDTAPIGLNSTLPANLGASCVDRTGDLSTSATTLGGNLAEPSGIDLVSADAKLTSDTLKVEFVTAGPIASAPKPEFWLIQGPEGQVGSYELKARPPSTGGAWVLTLTTWRSVEKGQVFQVPETVVNTPVTVDGTKLSYEVSQKDIPKAASYQWLFGTLAIPADGNTVIDDCDNSGGSTAGSTTPAPSSTVAPTTTAPVGALRQSLTYSGGETVTVYSVESPPEDPQAGATPPPAGAALVIADVKVCAGAAGLSGRELANLWFVTGTDGINYQLDPVAVPAHAPAFTARSLAANECEQAWVTFRIVAGVGVEQVIYAPGGDRVGGLIWKL